MKWQVSSSGGFDPAWRGDGREIFYVAPDSRLMVVTVSESSSGLSFGVPRALFRNPTGRVTNAVSTYAVSRDGQRFLVIEWPGEAIASPIAFVLGPHAQGESNP